MTGGWCLEKLGCFVCQIKMFPFPLELHDIGRTHAHLHMSRIWEAHTRQQRPGRIYIAGMA